MLKSLLFVGSPVVLVLYITTAVRLNPHTAMAWQSNTGFRCRWFSIDRYKRTLTYSRTKHGPPVRILPLVDAAAWVVPLPAPEFTGWCRRTAELHLKCKIQDRIYKIRGENLNEWRRVLLSVM